MGAISTHYGDIKNWIEKVIDSCITTKQLLSADKLIRNFDKILESTPETYWREYHYDIISPLKIHLDNKRDELLKQQLQ